MTKNEALEILTLLSALESALYVIKVPIPEHLQERLTDCTEILEREVLK